ncbi:SAUR-like auxin-responsive protein family [Actinidia rufa]|uniref:SAUR-like auxin-responsive protein family n=1 Tax=Actinidia rufa TaxID=165716 RepID=A0A7J0F8L4_9ERIC|nr:SAUR-like auxin-responsive protein family [Actinidia rufa]
MISPRKLIKMARNGQKIAAMKTKRISFPRHNRDVDDGSCSTSSVADKGHFVAYTADQKRFMIPLAYLNNEILKELFKLSEEVFGHPSDGPITLPCDSIFMEYIVLLIHRGVAKDLEKALAMSVATSLCSSSSSFHIGKTNQQLLVY